MMLFEHHPHFVQEISRASGCTGTLAAAEYGRVGTLPSIFSAGRRLDRS